MKRFEEAHIRFVHEGTNIGGYSLQYPAHFLAKEDLSTILPLYVEMSYLAAAPQNKCCESWRFARYIKPTQNSSIIEPICLSRRSLSQSTVPVRTKALVGRTRRRARRKEEAALLLRGSLGPYESSIGFNRSQLVSKWTNYRYR